MDILTPQDIKRILRNDKNNAPVDDFRLIDSWAEYEDGKNANERPLQYLCYEIEVVNPDTGKTEHLFKALKFLRVCRIPKDAKQSTALMDMQAQVLASAYENQYNLVTVIANMIEPVPLGLLYLYGVQGVDYDLEEAKRKADSDFIGLAAVLQGTYRVLHCRIVQAQETEWLRKKMYDMEYLTMVRGIPKASKAGENAGNKGMGNQNLNPNSQGTLEEFIAGMVDYEYVIQVLNTPVFMETLNAWQTQTQIDMTNWNGQLQGTKTLSANISMPMVYMANTGQSDGWSQGYTDSESLTYSSGETFTTGYGESLTKGISNSIGQSFGESIGHTVTDSVTTSDSLSIGQTDGSTYGVSENSGSSFGTSKSQSSNESLSNSVSETLGTSHGYSQSLNKGQTVGQTAGLSLGESVSQGQTISHGSNVGSSQSVGESVGHNYNSSFSENMGWNSSDNVGTSDTSSKGHTATEGQTATNGNTHTDSTNKGNTETNGLTGTLGGNTGGNAGIGGLGATMGDNHALSGQHSVGKTDGTGTSDAVNNSVSNSASNSISNTQSNGINNGSSIGESGGIGNSESVGVNKGVNQNLSVSQQISNSESFNIGSSQSLTNSISNSLSNSLTEGFTENTGTSKSIGTTNGLTISQGISDGVNQSVNKSTGQSASISDSNSITRGQSISNGKSVGTSQTTSTTNSITEGTSESAGKTSNVSTGQNLSKGKSTSQGQSLGTSGTINSGTSGSMGLGPSIGYNKSYQWLDQQVKDILELLEFQNERIKSALRNNGAFYTYTYIACPNQDVLSAAQALAKSTWHNEDAMIQSLQVMNLDDNEQKHLLYHFTAFSTDVTRINNFGVSEYKYSTVLLADELVAYTHLPRISEGGIYAEVNDVPKFAVASMMKGEIYMGSILSAERYSFKHGYETPYDYRISEEELMHGFFTGASRSGKTVAAMRFVAELAHIRRKKTGKRLRIVCMDPKQDWRGLAKYVEPERFRFYSLGNANFHPIKFNPCKIPKGVTPQIWIDVMIEIYCRAYGLLERGKQLMAETFYSLYEEAGVFDIPTDELGWEEKVSELSSQVTFAAAYKRMNKYKKEMEDGTSRKGRGGNDTKDAYSRLLERLSAFSRSYTIEAKLFGSSDGLGIDEIIGDDDVTVLESKGLESTFRSFIFGMITAGFYRYAIAHEGGFLHPDQYETVLVIEEANEVLVGSDVAGSNSGSSMGLSGQSEFEQILDQSAGYGLFIFAITQKISQMPSSIIANAGLVFAGKISDDNDISVVVRKIARDGRYDDRDITKWFPRAPVGWLVCQSSRCTSFIDMEPYLVKIAMLNISHPTNSEIDEILAEKEAKQSLLNDVN